MLLKKETWRQDRLDPDLWHGEGGVIVNTAALEARDDYFEVVRLDASLAESHRASDVAFFAAY